LVMFYYDILQPDFLVVKLISGSIMSFKEILSK